MNTYELVAMNYDNADELVLVRALGDALISWRLDTDAILVANPMKDTFRFKIDNSKLRNTVAHGIGCDLGFVCHIETGK